MNSAHNTEFEVVVRNPTCDTVRVHKFADVEEAKSFARKMYTNCFIAVVWDRNEFEPVMTLDRWS